MDDEQDRGVRAGSRASHHAPAGHGHTASIPDAVSLITQPFTVAGYSIKARWIANAIDLLADIPDGFATSALSRAIFPDGEPFPYARSEALNRLFQRWRKLGLVEFRHGRWRLLRGAWDKMQAQAIEARRAETQGGSVHESAVAESDAPECRQDTPNTTEDNHD